MAGCHFLLQLEFEVSGPTVPGEGEVKILGRLARPRGQHSVSPADTHGESTVNICADHRQCMCCGASLRCQALLLMPVKALDMPVKVLDSVCSLPAKSWLLDLRHRHWTHLCFSTVASSSTAQRQMTCHAGGAVPYLVSHVKCWVMLAEAPNDCSLLGCCSCC
jgi:hypothetical protein